MAQQFEAESRLKVSLATADGFYDQGLAVSQGIINGSFEKLYNKYEALQRIDWENYDGEMHAELLPSQILIPGSVGIDLSKIYHQIRFKSGTLSNKNGLFNVKLDGWMVAIAVDLDAQFINRDPGHKETPAEKKQREFIENEFDVPGDYRLERLYSKLTSANWNNFDMDHSKFINPDTGEEWTYDDWADADDNAASAFTSLCRSWARSMQNDGLTTLGLKITLPDLAKSETPTFTPTTMIHQIYPYHDKDDKRDQGFTSAGNANSLLYLEKVKDENGNDGQLPGAKQVGFAGNFCHPEAGLLPAVDGTFVVSHELFMGRFLLTQLQALNEASSIYVDPMYGGPAGWGFPMRYGSDPNYPNYKNSVYEFKQSNDGRTYEYDKVVDKSCDTKHNNGSHYWWQSDHWSKAHSTVSWQPGGDMYVEMKGSYEYYRAIRIADNASMQNPGTWSHEKYTGSWSLGVKMVSQDGTLVLQLVETSDLNFQVTGEMDQSKDLGAYHSNETKLRDEIAKVIFGRLDTLRNNLKQGFQGSHQFVFPGTGQLNFSDPTFSNKGDVISTVTWKPLDDGPVIVRPNNTDATKLGSFKCLQHVQPHHHTIPYPSHIKHHDEL